MTTLLVGKKIFDLKWIAKCEFCEGPIMQSFPVADTGNGGAFVFNWNATYFLSWLGNSALLADSALCVQCIVSYS